MSVLVPLPPWMREQHTVCYECSFEALHRHDEHIPLATVVVLDDPIMAGEEGFSIAPLCGHHAEMEYIDGVHPQYLDGAWKEYVESQE